LPVTVDRLETHWLIRLEGDFTIASAPQLKDLLAEWLASRQDLQLDLAGVQEIDVTLLQLLAAAAREAQRAGVTVAASVSPEAAAEARDLGFERFPGTAGG